MIDIPLAIEPVSLALAGSDDPKIRLSASLFLSDVLSSDSALNDPQAILEMYVDHNLPSLIARQLHAETSAPVLDSLLELISTIVLSSFDNPVCPSPTDSFIEADGVKGVMRCLMLLDATLSYRAAMALRVLAQFRSQHDTTSLSGYCVSGDGTIISRLLHILMQPVIIFIDPAQVREADKELDDETIIGRYHSETEAAATSFTARRVEMTVLLSILNASDPAFRAKFAQSVARYPKFTQNIRKILLGTLDALTPELFENALLISATAVPDGEIDAHNLLNDSVPVRRLFAEYMAADDDQRRAMEEEPPATPHKAVIDYILGKIGVEAGDIDSPSPKLAADCRGALYLACVIAHRANLALDHVESPPSLPTEVGADLAANRRDLELAAVPRLPVTGDVVSAAVMYEELVAASRGRKRVKKEEKKVEAEEEEENTAPQCQPETGEVPARRRPGRRTRPKTQPTQPTPPTPPTPYPMRDPAFMARHPPHPSLGSPPLVLSPARPRAARPRPLLSDLVELEITAGELVHAAPGEVDAVCAAVKAVKKKLLSLKKETLISPMGDASSKRRRPQIQAATKRLKAVEKALATLNDWLAGDEHDVTTSAIRAIVAHRLDPGVGAAGPAELRLAVVAVDGFIVDVGNVCDLVTAVRQVRAGGAGVVDPQRRLDEMKGREEAEEVKEPEPDTEEEEEPEAVV